MQQIDQVAQDVGQALQELQLRIVTAESCTGGWLSQVITDVPGSSQWFDRGFVSYSDVAKQEMLSVPANLIAAHGAVSEEVVKAMALGAIENSNSHLSIAITGVAGPGGGSGDKPIGTVWFAWGQKMGYVETKMMRFYGNRQRVRMDSVIYALQGALKRLKG